MPSAQNDTQSCVGFKYVVILNSASHPPSDQLVLRVSMSLPSEFLIPSSPRPWLGEDGRTPAMSSTSSVLRVFATWAAMVVPKVMGPKGTRLGGPSLAPVGLNKHKLYLWSGQTGGHRVQKGENKESRGEIDAQSNVPLLFTVTYTYIVAFSQEVKCKSVRFRRCRQRRQVSQWVWQFFTSGTDEATHRGDEARSHGDNLLNNGPHNKEDTLTAKGFDCLPVYPIPSLPSQSQLTLIYGLC